MTGAARRGKKAADAPRAAALTEGLRPKRLSADAADRSRAIYRSRAIQEAAGAAGARARTGPDPTREPPPRYDKRRYRNRNVVGPLSRRPKEFRRVATRREKKAENFPGTVWLAAFTINFDIHTT